MSRWLDSCVFSSQMLHLIHGAKAALKRQLRDLQGAHGVGRRCAGKAEDGAGRP
jgi:hypothetical protein